jgi:broad specificity phosphatase PhoE
VLGHEAVCVSHQLPIWTVRRYVEGRKLWHRPDRRQCGLASLTSITWVDDRVVTVTYSTASRPAPRLAAPERARRGQPRSGRVGDSPGAGRVGDSPGAGA